MPVPEWIRELRPHAIWRGIELLWLPLEALVVAALVALLQYLRAHLDLVSILLIFIGSLAILITGAFRQAKSPVVAESREAVLEKDNADLRQQLTIFTEERQRRDQDQAKRKMLLQNAPQILVEYSRTGTYGETEMLSFTNDGASTALQASTDSVSWKESRVISFANSLPPIPPKHTEKRQLYFEEKSGSLSSLY